MKDISEYSLFKPKSSRGLKHDYPEFTNIEEFKSLNTADLLFVWYYSCEVSPLVKEFPSDSKRVKKAMKVAYANKPLDHAKQAKFEALKFTDKIKSAIDKMSSFRVGPRIRAKLMMEKVMKTYEDIVDVDVEQYFKNKDGEVDFTKKKAYVDATATISKNMPTLISQLESGFGVSEEKTSDGIMVGGESLLETFHESNE